MVHKALNNLWFFKMCLTAFIAGAGIAIIELLNSRSEEAIIPLVVGALGLTSFFIPLLRKVVGQTFFSNKDVAQAAVLASGIIPIIVIAFIAYRTASIPDIPIVRGEYYNARFWILGTSAVVALASSVLEYLSVKRTDWRKLGEYDYGDFKQRPGTVSHADQHFAATLRASNTGEIHYSPPKDAR